MEDELKGEELIDEGWGGSSGHWAGRGESSLHRLGLMRHAHDAVSVRLNRVQSRHRGPVSVQRVQRGALSIQNQEPPKHLARF